MDFLSNPAFAGFIVFGVLPSLGIFAGVYLLVSLVEARETKKKARVAESNERPMSRRVRTSSRVVQQDEPVTRLDDEAQSHEAWLPSVANTHLSSDETGFTASLANPLFRDTL